MKHIKEIITAPKFRHRSNMILILFGVTMFGAVLIHVLLYYSLHIFLRNDGWDSRLLTQLDSHLITIGSWSTVIVVAVILIIALALTKSLGKTISIFSDRMMDIADGNWSTRINITRGDEFGQLASGFNFMAEHIEDSLRKIQSAKDYTDNILLSAPSILIVLSNRMRSLSVSHAFNKLRINFPSINSDQLIDALEQEIIDNLQTGNTTKNEITIQPAGSEEYLIFACTVSRIGNSGSAEIEEMASVLLTITDITAQKKMREMVSQARQDWEDTFDSIPDMITIHDKDMNIIQANKAAKKALNLGYLSPEKNNKCYHYYHGTDFAPEDCPSYECYRSGSTATLETYEPHLDKHLEVRTIPRVNDEAQTVGLIHIVRDISERREIEYEHNRLLASVTKAKIEWEETFDTVSEFIILIDKDFNIKRCNKSFAGHIGVSPDKLINRKCYDYFAPSDSQSQEHCKQLVSREEPMTHVEVKTTDNHWFYLSHRPICDKNGSYLHTVVIATNITDLKMAQEKLSKSEEDLKKKVNDLEKFYKMAVGRELRMKKLKKDIKKLEDRYQKNKDAKPVSAQEFTT
jgi:PAS domain S-box-containing protein